MKTYIIVGILAVIGLAVLVSLNSIRNSKTTEIAKNSKIQNNKIQQEKRNLKLVVSYDFGENQKIISEKATSEIIKSTMKSINWNEFHIVQLEDESNNTFKALHVSGSLSEGGLASGFVTDDDHILMVEPIKTVNQMTEILLDFLKGEDVWLNKYEYK